MFWLIKKYIYISFTRLFTSLEWPWTWRYVTHNYIDKFLSMTVKYENYCILTSNAILNILMRKYVNYFIKLSTKQLCTPKIDTQFYEISHRGFGSILKPNAYCQCIMPTSNNLASFYLFMGKWAKMCEHTWGYL